MPPHPSLCDCAQCLPHACPECDRNYRTPTGLSLHLKEGGHIGTYCAYCRRRYNTRPALLQHYESESCRTGRQRVKETIRLSYKANHIFEPTIPDSPQRAIATEKSYNPSSRLYECYLCPPEARGFRNLLYLQQHLSGPKHDAKHYRCPDRRCNRPFNTLASIHQHIEFRVCRWVAVSNNVKRLESGGVMLKSAIPDDSDDEADRSRIYDIYQKPELHEQEITRGLLGGRFHWIVKIFSCLGYFLKLLVFVAPLIILLALTY